MLCRFWAVSVWVKADAGATAQTNLWLHDTTGANSVTSTTITPGTSWQQITATYVADSTGKMRLHLHYLPGTGTVYYDDVQVGQISGWTLGFWGSTAVVTGAQAHSGGFALAESGSIEGGSYQDVSGLVAGQSYQVSVWVKADAGTTAQTNLWLHDTTGANAVMSATITPGTSWQQITLTYVANSTGKMRIHLHYLPGAGTIYYDDIRVAAPNPPGFDNHYKFTGKERDSETNLDYFGARYYSNGLGRFITPDWAAKAVAVPYADFGNPQTLNLYSYMANSPVSGRDPDGHCPIGGLCQDIINYISNWAAVGITKEGGKQFAKDAAIGGAQALGSAGYHAVMSSNPITMAIDQQKGEPQSLQPKNDVQAGGKNITTGAIVVTSVVAPAMLESAAPVAAETLAGRAEEIHGALDPIAQSMRTTAVANVTNADGTMSTLVSSSNNTLAPAQRAVLQSGETAVSGTGHAEETILNAAQKNGQTVNTMGVSRTPCASCAKKLKDAGVDVAGPR